MKTITEEQLDGLIKSAVNSSGPLPPDEKFMQIISALRELQEYRNADEPVMYQHRLRPSWRDSQPWTAWAECSAGVYGDSERYTATPDSAGYLYDVRKLYAAPQPAHVPQGGKAVQVLTTEIMELVDRITGHRLSVAKMSELRPCIFEACRAAMQSGAVKDGWVMVPKKLTAENGAKAALLGEFNLEYTLTCHECFGEGCDDCSGEGAWINTIPIDWTTIKDIWTKAIDHFAAAPQQEMQP